MNMHYLDYEASRETPNIVVDGSPNESTVLTLSHWPGVVAPNGLARDLSAEMAFAYLDDPPAHPACDVVTNNHFDQDGLVGIHALVEPEVSLAHRELLVDVAAAGDFGTYHDRRAARASMAIAAIARVDAEGGTDPTDRLYREMLPRLMKIVLDNDSCRHLWADEDAELTASERSIGDGTITIADVPSADLAVVTIPESEPVRSGHRFGHAVYEGLHPMALNNATDRFRVLTMRGRRYQYTDRYETWVQYCSRPTLPRVDLRPLADEMTALERAGVVWRAGSPSDLSPHLTHDGESSLEPDTVRAALTDVLGGAAGS